MLFIVEGTGVHYFWNGKAAMLVQVPEGDGEKRDWFWLRTQAKSKKGDPIGPAVMLPAAPEGEDKLLLTVSETPRKRSFKVPRFKNLNFRVIQRGVFGKDLIEDEDVSGPRENERKSGSYDEEME